MRSTSILKKRLPPWTHLEEKARAGAKAKTEKGLMAKAMARTAARASQKAKVWGAQSPSWVERRACHGCKEIGHILRDCPKAAAAGKGRAASVALEDAAGPPRNGGAFASFAVKRRPVGYVSDSAWRSEGSYGSATVDCEAKLC